MNSNIPGENPQKQNYLSTERNIAIMVQQLIRSKNQGKICLYYQAIFLYYLESLTWWDAVLKEFRSMLFIKHKKENLCQVINEYVI